MQYTQLEHETGLDYFHRHLLEGVPPAPFARLLGFKLTAVEAGRLTFEASPDERMTNPLGIVAGGYVATLLDSAMACAVHTTLPSATVCVTVEFKVNFVHSSRPDGPVLQVHGSVLSRGSQVATAEGKVFDITGRLIAHGTATCLITSRTKRS